MKKALIISIALNVLIVGFLSAKRFYYSRGIEAAPIQPLKLPLEVKSMINIDSSRIGKINKVLILGNSIVRHGPLPPIGWNNNWGMAATSIDSDFVHILIRDIKGKDSSCNIIYENIADFERDFDTYNFEKAKSFRNFNPDMIILRISENIDSNKAIDKGLLRYYDSLIKHIDPSGQAVKIIVGGFWRNDPVIRMLSDYAYFKDYTFIDQSGICSNETKAIGQWKDPGIQEHPNNKGMRIIEQSIWSVIGVYFQRFTSDTKRDTLH